ncbi:MAG: YeeE/YedE family protein [Chlorobi bacterium]|nr:YeeE/YedE family protein [Chlorobiota bacterium]
MIAPLFKFGYFNDEISLVVAFVIGIGFGFMLERGGFGSARLLAAQFYFTDMRVFKVMFTAIVTAMTGIFYLAWIGWVDLSLVYFTDTFLIPQALGGLILGIGFVIGGYCPGTSGVAIATGRKDAVVYSIGGMFGIFVFGELYPYMSGFLKSTHLGKINLPELLGVHYGVVVFIVILIAIAGFTVVEWGENLMAKKNKGGRNA